MLYGNDVRVRVKTLEEETQFIDFHDDVIKWKPFPRYWPFVRGIHRSPVNSLHKGQWRRAFMFSLICGWINGWLNYREAGDLRRHRAHYDVIVMTSFITVIILILTVPLLMGIPVHSFPARRGCCRLYDWLALRCYGPGLTTCLLYLGPRFGKPVVN